MALAVQRGSFEGIWSTSEKPIKPWTTKRDYFAHMAQALRRARQHTVPWEVPQNVMMAFDTFEQYVTSLHLFPAHISYAADATILEAVHPKYGPIPKIIWFQCPWTLEKEAGYTIAELIRRFVNCAAGFQEVGDTLLIGLVANEKNGQKYYHNYNYEGLHDLAISRGYSHEDDRVLIEQCMEYGYRLWNYKGDGLHPNVADVLIVHIFVRREILDG